MEGLVELQQKQKGKLKLRQVWKWRQQLSPFPLGFFPTKLFSWHNHMVQGNFTVASNHGPISFLSHRPESQLVTLIQPRQLALRAVDLDSTWVTHFACVDWIRGGHSKVPETSDTVINRHSLNIYREPSSRLRVNTPVQLCETSPPALNHKVTLPRGENLGRGEVG